MTEDVKENSELRYLDVNDISRLFRVGKSKARLAMKSLPTIKGGSKDFVPEAVLKTYITEHGGIPVKWPKRHRRRD